MLKRFAAVLLAVLCLGLSGCVSGGAGLNSYVNTNKGYEFLYPTGWVPVKVSGGPDVVFHDLIEETENVSVVINPVEEGQTLQDLGTPSELGQRLAQSIISSVEAGRKAELVNAEARESQGITYYLLEYEVELPNQKRHNLASAAVSRGRLLTFNVSTPERRWPKMAERFKTVVSSFTVY